MCLEIEALDEVVDERQCPQALTAELERVGREGGLTGLHLSFILTPEQSPVNHRISCPMENAKPNRRRLRQRTLALRRAINAMDFIVTGTLLRRTKVCGRANCRCASDPSARHGPYYEWNRRQDGRLVHRVIPGELARRVQHALENDRQIRALLAQWEQETVKELLDPDPD